jgi:hypothetical protein
MAKPFARAAAMFSLIAAAMGDQLKLAAIGPYKSRGHGRGSWAANNHKARSKYMPHQNQQEEHRRLIEGWSTCGYPKTDIYPKGGKV